MVGFGDQVSVGIDIGASALRGVALRQRGGHFEVLAAAESIRTPNHPVPTLLDVERLIQALQRQGFNPKSAVIAAPSDRLANAIVELPPRSSGAPIDVLAGAELNKNVPGELEVFVWDLPPGRHAKANEYLAIGFPHAAANELMSPFLQAGLTIEAIEPEMTALQRVTGANGRLVLDAGMRGLRIYAYDGSNALFFRHIELANEAVDSDRVRTSVTGTIDYVADRFPTLEEASVIVLGNPGQADRVSTMLKHEYDTSIVRDLRTELEFPEWLRDSGIGPRWEPAIGLAARPAAVGVAA